ADGTLERWNGTPGYSWPRPRLGLVAMMRLCPEAPKRSGGGDACRKGAEQQQQQQQHPWQNSRCRGSAWTDGRREPCPRCGEDYVRGTEGRCPGGPSSSPPSPSRPGLGGGSGEGVDESDDGNAGRPRVFRPPAHTGQKRRLRRRAA
ncbi:unnamed protein product, partial [Ectocarpus sp. 8 AP-2014]